jgi:demethylmenaquinone methyltransferase/2-methoxy-6-polyprenyl-1,4-benzoquinol methylase
LSSSVTPFKTSPAGKKTQVAEMFDQISGRYDFLNHFLTLGIDRYWRRQAIRMLRPLQPRSVLDIATGTGDFAIEARKLNPDRIVGVDISEGMLAIGRQKLARRQLADRIELVSGDSEALQFATDRFDAVTIGFGVRNFADLRQGLQEVHRVLAPGGAAVILEPGFPQKFPLKQLFHFYFTTVLPVMGRLISRNAHAYSYLPESVAVFPAGQEFLDICKTIGFQNTRWVPLTFGTCALYWLEKPASGSSSS